MLTTIGLAFAIVGAITIVGVIIIAAPRAVVLPTRRAPRTREERVKERIITERIMRSVRAWGQERLRVPQNLVRVMGTRIRQGYRCLRLRAQEYVVAKPEAVPMTCATAIATARAALARAEYEQAEEQFLACLKMDSKHRDAYLGLTELYRARHEDALADETFAFLRKLCPEDAEVAFLYAGLLQERGKGAAALREVQAAIARVPRNPKYLDFATALAIVMRKAVPARRWLEQLRDANPENQKLVEFEEQLGVIERTPRTREGSATKE
jgi:tetratricopeptide (TPR) repeat protein